MDDTKWTIRGGFVVLIRVSRCVGLAPVRLDPLHDGYSVSVSHCFAVFSKIFVTLLSTTGIVSHIIGLNYSQIKKEELLKNIFLLFNILTNLAIVVYATYNSINRMSHMGEFINLLEKVETNLTEECNSNINRRRKRTLLIHLMLYSFILLHTIVLNITRMSAKNFTAKLFLFVYVIVGFMQLLVELQIMYLALRILWSMMESIDQKLNSILNENINGSRSESEVLQNIRVLTRSYVDVCTVVLRTNGVDGLILCLIFAENIQSLLLNGYIFFLRLLKLSSLEWYQLLLFSACIAFTLKLLFFIDTYHCFIKKADSTRLALGLLLYQMTPVGEKISIELDLLYKQLTLYNPQYSPLGLFTLQRSVVVTVISLVTSCSVYLAEISS